MRERDNEREREIERMCQCEKETEMICVWVCCRFKLESMMCVRVC